MKPVVEQLKKEMADTLEFVEIDVDDPQHQEKVMRAGVMSIPTFVLERDGEEIDRKLGAMPKDAMVAWIQSHLS